MHREGEGLGGDVGGEVGDEEGEVEGAVGVVGDRVRGGPLGGTGEGEGLDVAVREAELDIAGV